MELVYMDGKKEPYTLSSIVAECAEIKHRHLKVLLNKHQEDFESFGKVQFKISPSESGQNVRDYILNEQQATLLNMVTTSGVTSYNRKPSRLSKNCSSRARLSSTKIKPEPKN